MSLNFTTNLEKSMEYLHKSGAFISVKTETNVNTMTISWGSIGFMWGTPIFTLLVRKSRFTHDLLEKTDEFTISIPYNEDLKEALKICGTKSGRDISKADYVAFEHSKKVSAPVVSGCNAYYECKIKYKHDINSEDMNSELINKWYSSKDMHTMYYAETVDCYFK